MEAPWQRKVSFDGYARYKIRRGFSQGLLARVYGIAGIIKNRRYRKTLPPMNNRAREQLFHVLWLLLSILEFFNFFLLPP